MYVLVQYTFVFIKMKKERSNLRKINKKNGLNGPILKDRLGKEDQR